MKLNYKVFMRKAKYYKTWYLAFQYGNGATLFVYDLFYRDGTRETIVKPCLFGYSDMRFKSNLKTCLVTCLVSSDVRYQTEYRNFINFLLSLTDRQKHTLAGIYGDRDFYLTFSDFTYPYESR